MGAHVLVELPAHIAWRALKKKKRRKVEMIFSPRYLKDAHDECIMAVVFEYLEPLLEKILACSLPREYQDVIDLFSVDDLQITINKKGNLIISGSLYL